MFFKVAIGSVLLFAQGGVGLQMESAVAGAQTNPRPSSTVIRFRQNKDEGWTCVSDGHVTPQPSPTGALPTIHIAGRKQFSSGGRGKRKRNQTNLMPSPFSNPIKLRDNGYEDTMLNHAARFAPQPDEMEEVQPEVKQSDTPIRGDSSPSKKISLDLLQDEEDPLRPADDKRPDDDEKKYFDHVFGHVFLG